MAAAVAGLGTRIILDRTRSTCTWSRTSAVLQERTEVFPLSSIAGVAARAHEWSDGAPTFSLIVTMAGGASFATGSSSSREHVVRAGTLVEDFVGRTISGKY